MSSSRASSSSPEPELVSAKSKKGKKAKGAHPSADAEKHGRNEGEDASLAYKPPEGYVAMKHSTEDTEFDWDAINNDENLELWVVRVPDGVGTQLQKLLPRMLNALIPHVTAQTQTS